MRWTDAHAVAERVYRPPTTLRRFLQMGVHVGLCCASVISASAQQPSRPAHAAATAQPQFLIVLDAAHGGLDTGAHLPAELQEKDLTLILSIRLRSLLSARGITVITTRESDETLPPAKRAAIANAHKPAACLILHASDSGSGIHLFTSSLAPAPAATFLQWDQAQAAYLPQSMRWSAEIVSAMTKAGVPVTLGRTAMQPLDNMTCPAAAVEVAPLTKDGVVTTTINDPQYQSRILAGLAAAVESWRRDWTLEP
jgi:N-acetylmuramoyl-L-alanine amidase